MMTRTNIAALGLAGVVALGAAAPSFAASVPPNGQVVRVAEGPVTNVHWRHRGWVPGAVVGGLALGALGAATAPYWYDDGYYGPYGYAYAPGPYYYDDDGWRWHHRHYWRHW